MRDAQDVGFRAAQQLWTRHAVAQDGYADAQVFHGTQLLVYVSVGRRRCVQVPAGAAHKIGATPEDTLGQGAAAGQVFQIW